MNAAVQFSLKHGKPIQVGNTKYVGANPQYFNIAQHGLPPQFVKVSKGVPYVKIR